MTGKQVKRRTLTWLLLAAVAVDEPSTILATSRWPSRKCVPIRTRDLTVWRTATAPSLAAPRKVAARLDMRRPGSPCGPFNESLAKETVVERPQVGRS